MSMIIGVNTTIATTVTAEEVKIVNDATLTVTGTLTCKKLIVEKGNATIQGSGAVYVVEEVPKPSPIMFAMQNMMLMLMITIFIYFIFIIIKRIFFKEEVYEKVF